MKTIITEKETKNMSRSKSFAAVVAAAGLLALPAFSQETPARQEASVQAFGSFVKSTTDNGVQQNDNGVKNVGLRKCIQIDRGDEQEHQHAWQSAGAEKVFKRRDHCSGQNADARAQSSSQIP